MVGFWHAGVIVESLERSLRFYRDGLGLDVETTAERSGDYVEEVIGLRPESLAVAMLRVPGSDELVELVEYRGIERHPASCRPCDLGSGHFCLFVDDLDAVHARLTGLGYSSRRPVATLTSRNSRGAKVVYAIDPDGSHVDLLERATSEAGAA